MNRVLAWALRARERAAAAGDRPFVATLWCAVAVFIVATVKSMALFHAKGPTVFRDETYHFHNALNFFAGALPDNAIYPPVYSLYIAISGVLGDSYAWIPALNVVALSAGAIVAFYAAVRMGSLTSGVLAALFVLVLPAGAVFPFYVLAENLHITLFTLSVVVVALARRGSLPEAMIVSSLLSITYLTKYHFMPAAILLAGIYLFSCLANSGRIAPRTALPFLVSRSVAMAVPALAFVGGWIWLCHVAGISGQEAVGADVLNRYRVNRWSDGPVWVAVYALYWALSWAILLPFIAVAAASVRFNAAQAGAFARSPLGIFTISVVVLCGVYILGSAAHSFLAPYNRNGPVLIAGRYLSALVPCGAVLAAIAVVNLSRISVRSPTIRPLVSGVVVCGLAAFSWWYLYREASPLPADAVRTRFLTPDTAAAAAPAVAALIFVAMALSVLAIMLKRSGRLGARAFIMASAVLVMAPLSVSYAQMYKQEARRTVGLHALNVWRAIEPISSRSFHVYHGVPGLTQGVFAEGLYFFDKSIGRDRVHPLGAGVPARFAEAGDILLAPAGLLFPVLNSYRVNGEELAVYRIDEVSVSPRLVGHGPSVIVAGRAFNEQPSGEAAMWLQVENLSRYADILLNGMPVPSSRNGDVLAFGVPRELYAAPGELTVEFHDRLTGARGVLLVKTIEAPISRDVSGGPVESERAGE